MEFTEKQELIIKTLGQIADMSGQLMNMAVTGDDGNLREMAYHIQCYSKKIAKHLQTTWANNIKFKARQEAKRAEKLAEREQEEKEIKRLERNIYFKYLRTK
jgi:hypothetical protein